MTNPIGHSSPSFCHDDPVDTLKACAEAGFDVWEIVGDGRHALREAAPRILDHLDSYDVTLQVHLPIADVNIGSLNQGMQELSLQQVEEAIEAAPRIGIVTATLHPGHHSPLSRGHYEKLHEATRAAIKRLAPRAADVGVELNLENVPFNWAYETHTPGRILDLIEGTDLGITLDLGHAHVADTLDAFVSETADRIRNVHVHDNHGSNDDHLTLDEGGLPWRKALDGLLEAGYKGTFVVESRSHESGRRSRGLLRQHLE